MIIIILSGRNICSQIIKAVIETRRNNSSVSYYQYRLTQFLHDSSHYRKKQNQALKVILKDVGLLPR